MFLILFKEKHAAECGYFSISILIIFIKLSCFASEVFILKVPTGTNSQ